MARILGLDVDAHALRGVVVRTSFRKVEVERFVRIPLQEGEADDEGHLSAREAVTRLSGVLQQPPDAIAMALDGKHVSLRRLTLPKAAERRASEVLVFELESLLPFDAEDAVIDHQVVRTDAQQVDLLVAAALQSHVETALADLSALGLSPRELCPAPVYLEDLIGHIQVGGTCIVMELRDGQTDIALVSQGACLMARTLAQSISSTAAGTENFLRAVQMTVSSFRASGAPEPMQVVLVGHGAELPGVREWLNERLQLPVFVPQLTAALGTASGPEFGRALGLAMRAASARRRINFRSGRFKTEESTAQWGKHANLAISCAVAVLVSFMFSLKAQQSLLLDEQAALQAQLADTTKSVFGKTASTVAGAELLMKSPKGDPLPRFDAFDTMAAISAAIDEEITHEVRRLRIEVGDDKREGRLELQGMVSSIEQRDAIAQKLEEHPCMSEIEKGKTSSVRGQENINYQLEAIVQCPGEGPPSKKKPKSAGSNP